MSDDEAFAQAMEKLHGFKDYGFKHHDFKNYDFV